MRLQMALLILTLTIPLVAARPALAQSANQGAPQKAPAQQPGVAARPAQTTDTGPSTSPAAQAPAAAAKLDAPKDAAIRHLMDITDTSKMGVNIQAYITQQVQDAVGRAMAPDKAQKFMETFSLKFDASSPPSAVTDAMVTIYAKNFSMEDIQGLIQFYETPLGKRVVQTMPQVSQQSQQAGVEMDQKAALSVLRGMSTDYPEIKPMLPQEDGKPAESAPAPSVPPAPKPAPAPMTPAAPKPAPQN
jgi:uncharacterized protein